MKRTILLRATWGASIVALAASPAFGQTPPASSGTVTLPLAEYERLVERAAKPPAPPLVAPVGATVSRAEVRVVAAAQSLRGTIDFEGDVLRAGTIKIPLVTGGIVIDVQQSGRPVPVLDESGTTCALLSATGPFRLMVSWAAQVRTEPGRATALLPAVHAGTVNATIDAPGENADVRVARAVVGSTSTAAGRTVAALTLEPGFAAELSWSSREARRPAASRAVRLGGDVKTLVTIGEAEVRVVSLFDVTVLEGEPERLEVRLPEGFELAGLSGASVEPSGGGTQPLGLEVREPAARRHQFLVRLERAIGSGRQHARLALPALAGTQRETGEVALEGEGTVELTAVEKDLLRRLDASEASAALVSLARRPILAAFRYQKRTDQQVDLEFDVRRFEDAAVLTAAAESATATTLVSAEGRHLTELTMTVRNRGQLFLKIGLAEGATLLSAEVAGETVKPVEGSDGVRIPLVRPGFQPAGAYPVSFVYTSAGAALGKSGRAEMKLPAVDMPIGVLEWEIFLPDSYKVKRFTGDAIPRETWDRAQTMAPQPLMRRDAAVMMEYSDRLSRLSRDQVGGKVIDTSGAAIPGATVVVVQGSRQQAAVTDARGEFVVSGLSAAPVTITAQLAGFRPVTQQLESPGQAVQMVAEVAGLQETVNVQAQAPKQAAGAESFAPSQNVQNLQRRVAGVLPVRIDIPRAGQSYYFVRPLVLSEETLVGFEYKRR